MNSEFQKGFITGLAVKPLAVTSGVDIIKFGTHNLLTDSGVIFDSAYTSFSVNGENCICTVKECSLNDNWWYRAIGGLSFKSGYMYKLEASRYNGYGRFGITNIPGSHPLSNVGRNAYGTFPFDPNVPSDGDNHVLQNNWIQSQFYIGRNSSGYSVKSTSGELWLCTDLLYNGAKASHSFGIALYEEVKA